MKNIPYRLILWCLFGACAIPYQLNRYVLVNIPDESFRGEELLFISIIEAFITLIVAHVSLRMLFHKASFFKILGLIGLIAVLSISFMLRNAEPLTQVIALATPSFLLLWLIPNIIVETWLDRMKISEEKRKRTMALEAGKEFVLEGKTDIMDAIATEAAISSQMQSKSPRSNHEAKG